MENKLDFYSNCIIKKYNPEEKNFKLSSLNNELFCIEKFRANGENPYCPNVLRLDETTYAIERYSFDLGEAISINKNKVRRMFFTISYKEFERQIDEIISWLKKLDLNHRDFNPSNLIFCEKERRIKLIDFYWTKTNGITVGNPGQLNWFYGTDDENAATKIKSQIKEVFDEIYKESKDSLNPILEDIGVTYYDGSSTQKGQLYQILDVGFLRSTPFIVESSSQLQYILKNISIYPKTLIDIGPSASLYSFNILRNFRMDKVYLYEADPYMNKLLIKIKGLFGLNEVDVKEAVVGNTDFPKVDLVLMMNVHMWLYKQLGKETTDTITSQLIRNSKQMFFQTSGSEGKGMHTLNDKEFSSKEEIEKYLYSLGAKKVYYITETPIHSGIRHLFKIEGE